MDCETDVLVLGAGLARFGIAAELERHATVLERDDRPGGLVRTECFDGYWFDRVIHLLYFSDSNTQTRISSLLGSDLVRCSPVAWVECSAGTVRFPFQIHFRGLESTVAAHCLHDFLQSVSAPQEQPPPDNFEEMLLRTFGKTMCEVFFFPYNRKVWKRPLSTLAPSGFQWNIVPPLLDQILHATDDGKESIASYNCAGWYPRPERDASVRGMEVLSRALARKVADIRFHHSVEAIDLEARVVTARHKGTLLRFRFIENCISTIPLPELMMKCLQVPENLRKACVRLKSNRVLSAAFSIRGPRPMGRGHWRYYADESVIFSRLMYMHEFDPECAPEDGWSLIAEVIQPAEDSFDDPQAVLARVQADIVRVGALPPGCIVVASHLLSADPAYVVFSVHDANVVERAKAFLAEFGIICLGRYGRWEYSSMSQVMRDGFDCGTGARIAISRKPARSDRYRPESNGVVHL